MLEGLKLRHWRFEVDEERVLSLTLDRSDSSVNALSQAVLKEFGQILERAQIEAPRAILICSGKPRGFIPGADISEFERYDREGRVAEAIATGHRVFDALAAMECPTVAAIHGFCMGGGLELALACRHRIASDDPSTRLGLPEVKLGIHPGWGGMVRLPPLIGAPQALDLILSGRAVSASSARKMGLVDQVVSPADLLASARSLALKSRRRGQRFSAWISNLLPVRLVLAQMVSRTLARKARREHYPAPYAALDIWRRHGGSPRKMQAAEQRSVVKLSGHSTTRNLMRVYFLQERLKSGSKDAAAQRLHVVGAGVMGADIAAWSAAMGLDVSLQDQSAEALTRARSGAQTLFDKKLKTSERVSAAMQRLSSDVAGERSAQAELVIEAIFEDLDAKRQLFTDLEKKVPASCILATNTSSIPLQEIGTALSDPSRLVGIHFFNPVAMMPLVEVVRHEATSRAAIDAAMAYVRRIDKLPLEVSSTPGFLVNRILMPYMLEAMIMHSEGVPGAVIDRAALKFGMPMGPIELADQVGLDVCRHVGGILGERLGFKVPDGLAALVDGGKRGRKDGQGLYTWVDNRAQKPDVPKDYRAPEDLTDRMILPFLNQAVACLREGVVGSAEELDAGVIFATGFAPFRGGPWQYAMDEGPGKLKHRLEALSARHGERFKPDAGWDTVFEPAAKPVPRAA